VTKEVETSGRDTTSIFEGHQRRQNKGICVWRIIGSELAKISREGVPKSRSNVMKRPFCDFEA